MSESRKYLPKNPGPLFFLFLLFLMGPVFRLQAQSFDYESHPKLDFNFTDLELDLGVQPQNLRIDGAAHYQLTANISEADTVVLYTSHLDINSVSVNGSEADYMLHNDSLFVPLDEPSHAGNEYTLDIRYSGSAAFGLLKNANESVWTSLLPNAQRHWVPIIDNPNVTLKTKFNISVPSGFSVWATGEKTGEEAVSVDAMTYHFASDSTVPASSLSFALGHFDRVSRTVGDTQVNVVTEQAAGDSTGAEQLAGAAVQYLSQIQDSLQVGYPFGQLNVIVLDDHSWEKKWWGASTVFLYRNRGSLQAQLLRGIVGQWFGVYQREAKWSESDTMTLYQVILNRAIADSSVTPLRDEDVPDTAIETVYDGYGVQQWNRWLQRWDSWEDRPMKDVVEASMKGILENLPPVVDWSDYAEFWYRKSGQPLFKPAGIAFSPDTSASNEKQVADSIAYNVVYTLNEAEGQLKLRFSATSGVYKQLTSVNAYEVYPGRTDTLEVTFTGARDSVMLQVDPMINTLRLQADGHPELHLDEYKPASFLIYEFRHAKTVGEKAEAARKLGYHSENPDLQLAVEDFLKEETEPEVKAALLSSLGDITQGAAGTEQTFLEALKSENERIRDAALMALQYFKNDARVRDRIQNMAINAGDPEVFKKATQVLMSIDTPEQFAGYADAITQQDSVGRRSIFVIQQLANMGQVEAAVKKAGLFTEDQFNYEVRSTALGVLIQHDHSPGDWLNRAKQLLDDADPRIRYLVVGGLQRNLDKEITDYLRAHIQDEYDARVYQRMSELIAD